MVCLIIQFLVLVSSLLIGARCTYQNQKRSRPNTNLPTFMSRRYLRLLRNEHWWCQYSRLFMPYRAEHLQGLKNLSSPAQYAIPFPTPTHSLIIPHSVRSQRPRTRHDKLLQTIQIHQTIPPELQPSRTRRNPPITRTEKEVGRIVWMHPLRVLFDELSELLVEPGYVFGPSDFDAGLQVDGWFESEFSFASPSLLHSILTCELSGRSRLRTTRPTSERDVSLPLSHDLQLCKDMPETSEPCRGYCQDQAGDGYWVEIKPR